MAELEAIDEASNGIPMAVLASGANLDYGPARDLLLKFADNPDNAIIITDSQKCVPRPASMFVAKNQINNNPFDLDSNGAMMKSSSTGEDGNEGGPNSSTLGNTLSLANTSRFSSAAQLLMKWCEAKEANQEMADVVEIDVLVPHRSPLVGIELKAFHAEEEAARQEKKAQEERKALLREVELARGRLRLGEEDVDENTGTNADGATSNTTSAKQQSSTTNGVQSENNASTSAVTNGPPPKKKSRFNQNLFLKFSKPVHSEL